MLCNTVCFLIRSLNHECWKGISLVSTGTSLMLPLPAASLGSPGNQLWFTRSASRSSEEREALGHYQTRYSLIPVPEISTWKWCVSVGWLQIITWKTANIRLEMVVQGSRLVCSFRNDAISFIELLNWCFQVVMIDFSSKWCARTPVTLATGTSGPVAKSLEKSRQKSRPKAERKATKVAKVAAKVAKAVARAAKVVKQLRLAKCPKPSLGPSMLQTSLPAEKNVRCCVRVQTFTGLGHAIRIFYMKLIHVNIYWIAFQRYHIDYCFWIIWIIWHMIAFYGCVTFLGSSSIDVFHVTAGTER